MHSSRIFIFLATANIIDIILLYMYFVHIYTSVLHIRLITHVPYLSCILYYHPLMYMRKGKEEMRQ